MEKYATKTQTGEYFKKHQLNQTKTRHLDDLTVSALAVGTYLGASTSQDDRLYEEALVFAAQKGINFFDTAINYRCQRSEKNIAFAVRKLAGMGLSRDQIVVSTKGGFLPAEDNPETFQEYILKCFLNTGIMTPEDIVENCHCMTPKFLQSQIDLSLVNLKLSCIDLYYLHNPEIQLPVVGESEFYQRVTKVFELFEKNVADGKIQRYGVATWDGFRQGFGSEARLDLAKIIQCAREVAGDDHHFKAIQLPYNLAMMEAVGVPSQKVAQEEFPIIPAAVHHGISVLVSAPLMQSHILKLPQELYDHMPGQATTVQKGLQFVLSSPGVVAAMVGMKDVRHVEENLAVLGMDAWEVADLQRVAGMLVQS